MILVTAAGGRTGRHLIRALVAKGLQTRALVRRDDSGLLEIGASELAIGDMLNRADLRRACEGVSAVIHNGPISPDETVMGRWAVDAARDAGVAHFVYVSVTHPQTEWLINHQNKLKVEDYLINSGLPFTILQPMHYFQNINVPAAVEAGVYASPYSRSARLSFVDLVDLAEAAARVTGSPDHHFATYEICGSDYLNTDEVAAMLADKSGRAIVNHELALPEFLARIPGTDGYLGDMLARLMTYYARYGIRGNPNVLAWLLGRPPTTLSEYVERMLQAEATTQERP